MTHLIGMLRDVTSPGPLGVSPSLSTPGAPVHYASLDSEVAIVAIVMGSFATVAYPLIRAFARKLEAGAGRGGQLSSESEQRLERMERAIDSIAIEVERISEAQRFTTKLLAERSAAPSASERTP